MAAEQSIPELRPIPGFPDYFADREGGIWTTVRMVRDKANGRFAVSTGHSPARKKPTTSPTGDQVVVSVSVGDRQATRSVARFVLMAWVGMPPSPKHQAAHNNGDPSDNRLENLRWATPSENAADKDVHGTAAKGERHPKAKMTWAAVEALRADRLAGLTYKQLGQKYGINLATAHRIATGVFWRKPDGNA